MTERLDDKQRQRIILRHKASIERYGYTPTALFWSNREVQLKRFEVLSRILPSLNSSDHQAWSVLDVGCGFADFYAYLRDQGYDIQYTGVDLSPDMIFSARSMYPQLTLLQGELSDQIFSAQTFDFVFLSGALNEVVDDTGEYAKSVIRQLYLLARYGVAFNLLNRHDPWIASRADLQSFYPKDIMVFCENFAEKVDWCADYLPNDFTVFLTK